MMANELKPCPFCGGEAITGSQELGDCHIGIYFGVGCETTDCFAEFDIGECWYDTEQEAIIAWNTRASSWIAVADRLPPVDADIIATDGDCTEVGFFSAAGTGWCDFWFAPTHWMLLPEVPVND